MGFRDEVAHGRGACIGKIQNCLVGRINAWQKKKKKLVKSTDLIFELIEVTQNDGKDFIQTFCTY